MGGSITPRPETADLEPLVTAIRERRAILFAGAGLSMAVGLPSWHALVAHMAADLGIEDPSSDPGGLAYPTLAEYCRMRHGDMARLRDWLAQHWRVSADRVRRSPIHRLIVRLGFPIIYTTNYDRNLEAAHEVFGAPFVRIANAAEMARGVGAATRIIKFHGDFEDPDSLVVTESQYFDRLAFDSPMDIAFRADAMGRTILFVGYSMSDTNIRLLLYRLWQMWERSGRQRHRPPAYLFLPHPDPVQAEVLAQWGITVVSARGRNAEAALRAFLKDLEVRVGAGSQQRRAAG